MGSNKHADRQSERYVRQ